MCDRLYNGAQRESYMADLTNDCSMEPAHFIYAESKFKQQRVRPENMNALAGLNPCCLSR